MTHEHQDKASRIIDAMMAKDLFSQWLGIQRLEEREGYCKIGMTVRPEMCNGFDLAHGGITYSLADSCLAFAANARGRVAVSVETTISHLLPLKPGDTIVCESSEENLTRRFGVYYATLTNQNGEKVALFKGVYYRTDRDWEV